MEVETIVIGNRNLADITTRLPKTTITITITTTTTSMIITSRIMVGRPTVANLCNSPNNSSSNRGNLCRTTTRLGGPLTSRYQMKTWTQNSTSCRITLPMCVISNFWWRSSFKLRKPWHSQIRPLRRQPDQFLGRIITISTSHAESLMSMVKWLKCTCASSKNWRRRQALSELGRISSVFAMIVRRSEIKLWMISIRLTMPTRKSADRRARRQASLKSSESSNRRQSWSSPDSNSKTRSFPSWLKS